MMMIAQLPTPSGHELMSWLGSAGLVLLVAERAVMLVKHVRGAKVGTEITPQPLDVRMVQDFVRKDECVTRHADSMRHIEAMDQQLGEMRMLRAQDMKDNSASRAAMYQAIKEVRNDLSAKIEQMPAQIVSQMLNSKRLFQSGDL